MTYSRFIGLRTILNEAEAHCYCRPATGSWATSSRQALSVGADEDIDLRGQKRATCSAHQAFEWAALANDGLGTVTDNDGGGADPYDGIDDIRGTGKKKKARVGDPLYDSGTGLLRGPRGTTCASRGRWAS